MEQRSTGVLKKLGAVEGRYIKGDVGPALVLREADGTEVLCTDAQGQQCRVIVSQAILDSLVENGLVVQDDGKFRLTPSGTEQAQRAANRDE
jgi:hypothetical protein